ncbi:MAG: DUF2905 family protein [Patescibacteria group bacterium]
MANIILLSGIAILSFMLIFVGNLSRITSDMAVARPGYAFYFPITTMMLMSIVLSFIFWILRR